MPFTPLHMGPAILLKSLLRGAFSLMVFGWTQIVMDLQPLLVILSGHGHLHGFTHTYLGALLIGLFCALSGKYLAELGLQWLSLATGTHAVTVTWPIAVFSALVGSASHVLLDSLMHGDLQPFYPWWPENPLLHRVDVFTLHQFCLYSGLLGTLSFCLVNWYQYYQAKLRQSKHYRS